MNEILNLYTSLSTRVIVYIVNSYLDGGYKVQGLKLSKGNIVTTLLKSKGCVSPTPHTDRPKEKERVAPVQVCGYKSTYPFMINLIHIFKGHVYSRRDTSISRTRWKTINRNHLISFVIHSHSKSVVHIHTFRLYFDYYSSYTSLFITF